MWHSRPPRDPPPPFMANTILNFHFDYWHPSLIYRLNFFQLLLLFFFCQKLQHHCFKTARFCIFIRRRRRSFKIREVFLSEPESDHCGVVLWRLDWCQGLKSWLLDYFEDVDVFSSDVEHDVEEAFCNSLVIDDNFAATYLQFGRDWNCLVTTWSRIVVVAVWQLLGNNTQLSGPLCHWQCLGIWDIIYDMI